MDDQNLPAPVAKRASELVVGDRVPDEHLPYKFHEGPAMVVYTADEYDAGVTYTFIAYRYPNGRHESHTVLSDAVLEVFPAADPIGQTYSRADDGETTQPIAGRVPPHFGALVGASLVPQPIARHYDASEFADDAVCACGEAFGSVDALKDHIAAGNAVSVVNEGGHTAVEVAGGLIAIDPPEGFVPASAPSDDEVRCATCGFLVGEVDGELEHLMDGVYFHPVTLASAD